MNDPPIAVAVGACWACGELFTFNPHRVPSIPINGVRQPICKLCVQTANESRLANGVDPIEVLPGAYDPLVEGEL